MVEFWLYWCFSCFNIRKFSIFNILCIYQKRVMSWLKLNLPEMVESLSSSLPSKLFTLISESHLISHIKKEVVNKKLCDIRISCIFIRWPILNSGYRTKSFLLSFSDSSTKSWNYLSFYSWRVHFLLVDRNSTIQSEPFKVSFAFFILSQIPRQRSVPS